MRKLCLGSVKRLLLAGLLALFLAGLVAGCGSSGGSGSTGASSSVENGTDADSAGTQTKLEGALKPWEEFPEHIAQTKPLKALPTGKSFAFLECGLSACVEINEGLEKATKLLGVNYTAIPAGSTPESFQAAASQAVQEKPDVLIMAALSGTYISRQLKELKAEGVKVIDWSTEKNEAEKFDAYYVPPSTNVALGEAMANYTILHNGPGQKVLYLNMSTFGVLNAIRSGIENALNENCSDCTLDEVDALPEEIGTTAPSKVVSFLQKDPSTEYQIISSAGALTLGLPQAIRAAGLKANIVASQTGTPNAWEDVKDGTQEMLMEIDLRLLAFYGADAGARLLAGEQPLSGSEVQVYKLITGAEIDFDPSTEKPELLPTYEEEFAKIWGSK